MPNRIIKESFCTSDDIAALSWFEQVLFIRLIVSVDDFGRIDARPSILKGKLFPLDNVTVKNIDDGLAKLSSQGMIDLYEVGGKPYLCLTAWMNHQTPRAKESKYPAPERDSTCKHLQADASRCKQMQADAPDIRYSNSIFDIRYSESENAHTTREEQHGYGRYGWVKLTDSQYKKLVDDLGQAEASRCIDYVDESAQTTNNKNKWKDWNLVVRKCHRDNWGGYHAAKYAKKGCNVFSELLREEQGESEAVCVDTF